MNRFKKAWLALTNNEPPTSTPTVVERIVIGDASKADLYQVEVYINSIGKDIEAGGTALLLCGSYYSRPLTTMRYFLTCSQAHAAYPGHKVARVGAIKIADEYFLAASFRAIEIQPKPKRAKGSPRG